MRVAVLALTSGGKRLSTKLCQHLPFEIVHVGSEGIKATVSSLWKDYDGIIFIMATGIVVRAIAPMLRDKNSDPCIIALDEGGNFAISLLSGHIGGGNSLASEIAKVINATAVITTASDVLGLTSIDIWAKYNNLVASKKVLTQLSSLLVNNGKIHVVTDFPGQLPDDFILLAKQEMEKAELAIVHQKKATCAGIMTIHPKTLVIGIGCNRNTERIEIEDAVRVTCKHNGLAVEAIDSLASIDLKSDEVGLLEFADFNKIPLHFYSAEQLNTVEGLKPSKAVFSATGAYGVSEPAALLQARSTTLIVEKTKWKNVTIAIAAKTVNLSAKYS